MLVAQRSGTLGVLSLMLLFASASGGCKEPPRYLYLNQASLRDSQEVAETWAALPLDSIILSRGACHGTCPRYRIAFKKYGAAEYKGEAYVERKGTWRGHVEVWAYGELCRYIERNSYFNSVHNQQVNSTEGPKITVQLWRTGHREPITLENKGVGAPNELWVLQSAVDGVASDIDWIRIDESQ